MCIAPVIILRGLLQLHGILSPPAEREQREGAKSLSWAVVARIFDSYPVTPATSNPELEDS